MGSEMCIRDRYLTAGNPSASVAARATRWLTDDGLRAAKKAELDVLASRFAIAGATDQAADYILRQLGVSTVALPASKEVGDLEAGAMSRKSA